MADPASPATARPIPDLPRRGPLDGHPAGDGGAAGLRVLAPATRLVFRGDEPARAACAAALGVDLPRSACRAAAGDGRAALWLGPDEWLLLARHGAGQTPAGPSAPALAETLVLALAPLPHSLVDVSHRQVGLLLAGPRAADLLNTLVMLDLDPAAFPVGACARTLFGKAEIVLWRCGDDAFRIEVWRSFAPYVAEMLTEASFGLD